MSNAMVERLKKCAAEDREEGLQDGRRDGKEFAEKHGTLRQIRGIAEEKIVFDETNPIVDWFESIGYAGRRDLEESNPTLLEDGEYTDGYAEGFAEAVTTAWEEVKSEI